MLMILAEGNELTSRIQRTSNQVSFHAGPAYAEEENASQDPIGSAFLNAY